MPSDELCELILSAQQRQLARLKSKERKGWSEWYKKDYLDSMTEALHTNIKQGQWIDVMNFAMFLWNLDGRKNK